MLALRSELLARLSQIEVGENERELLREMHPLEKTGVADGQQVHV